MINREDMLELTRRMTPSRASIGRIAGAYFDGEGLVDGTFNTNFLKLSLKERTRQLGLAKAIPFSASNVQLRDYPVPPAMKRAGGLWQLLDGLKECELKNDGLLEVLYELVGERFQPGFPYAFLLFHGSYDVPAKGSDGQWLEGSEEVYRYLIAALCPVSGDYEPGKPQFGFLYPAFRGRTGDDGYVNLFEQDPDQPHRQLSAWLLGKD